MTILRTHRAPFAPLIFWSFGALLFFAPVAARGAELYFTPDAGSFQPGETAAVDLRLDTKGECINAAEVNVGFPRELMEVVDVSRGSSIFTLWVQAPTVRPEFGLISFIGGVPGGYCGRTPGDPALTNVIAKLIFRFTDKAKTLPGSAKITILGTSRLVLNDGFGTEAKLIPHAAEFTVATTGHPQSNAWTEAVKNDKISPEIFSVAVYRDPAIFENRAFIVFSTPDKQTGLDHYEIAEIKDPKNVNEKTIVWNRADSPYVLKDQSLRSLIRVRAFDKAGNVQTAEYLPSEKERPKSWYWLWLAGSAVALLAIIRFARFIPW